MKNSPPSITPLLLRNFLTSIFIHADKSFIHLSQKYKFLEFLRYFLTSVFLLFLRLLPSFFPNLNPSIQSHSHHNYPYRSTEDDKYAASVNGATISSASVHGGDNSGVSRALSQLLIIMNDIPVSSRKYEVVRSLAENLINENLFENNETLTEVNCAVLTAAFSKSMNHLEASMVEQGQRSGEEEAVNGAHDSNNHYSYYIFYKRASRLVRGAKHYGRVVWRYAKSRNKLRQCVSSAEKLAAELLWVAQKMNACGCADEAVWKWAEAANLACLALSAEPRLQGSLVKVSAFFIKHAKEMGEGEGEAFAPSEKQQIRYRKIKMKLLMSWLPLLCRASNGTDVAVLSMAEKAELERILEEIISTLEEEEEQERVLSLWLHHFTYCSASDWPNLRNCYNRWLNASRQRLLQATAASVKAVNNEIIIH